MASLVHVTAWEKAAPWRRILCAVLRVGILVAFLIVLFELLGPPLGFLITSRWEARKAPWLKVTPKPLVNYSASDSAGTALLYFGYEFEVPWNAPYKTKAIGKGGLVQLQFESGQNVTFIVPANQNGLFTEIVQDKSLRMENLQAILGDLVNRPAYDQYETLLSTTPSSIHAFGPRTEAVRGMTLLIIKAIAVGPGLETGVFSFECQRSADFRWETPKNRNAWTLKFSAWEVTTSRLYAPPQRTPLD